MRPLYMVIIMTVGENEGGEWGDGGRGEGELGSNMNDNNVQGN